MPLTQRSTIQAFGKPPPKGSISAPRRGLVPARISAVGAGVDGDSEPPSAATAAAPCSENGRQRRDRRSCRRRAPRNRRKGLDRPRTALSFICNGYRSLQVPGFTVQESMLKPSVTTQNQISVSPAESDPCPTLSEKKRHTFRQGTREGRCVWGGGIFLLLCAPVFSSSPTLRGTSKGTRKKKLQIAIIVDMGWSPSLRDETRRDREITNRAVATDTKKKNRIRQKIGPSKA